MKITARIELPKKLTAKIKELKMPLSGGYEQGFEDGKEAGYADGVIDGEAIGYEKGHADGYEDGAAELDRFWDIYQQNGERTNYQYAFSYEGWTADSFKPKYAMKPINASYMFQSSNINGDLRNYCNLDLSVATNVRSCFSGSIIIDIGVCDFTSVTALTTVFSSCKNLRSIELLKLKESNQFVNTFSSCNSLEEIRIGGTIGFNLDLKSSPLSVASMKNIIEHLKDFNGSGSEFSQKLSFSDTCWAELEADSFAPDGGTWKNYVYSLGWNT